MNFTRQQIRVLVAISFWLGGFVWYASRRLFDDLPMWVFVLVWTTLHAAACAFNVMTDKELT